MPFSRPEDRAGAWSLVGHEPGRPGARQPEATGLSRIRPTDGAGSRWPWTTRLVITPGDLSIGRQDTRALPQVDREVDLSLDLLEDLSTSRRGRGPDLTEPPSSFGLECPITDGDRPGAPRVEDRLEDTDEEVARKSRSRAEEEGLESIGGWEESQEESGCGTRLKVYLTLRSARERALLCRGSGRGDHYGG